MYGETIGTKRFLVVMFATMALLVGLVLLLSHEYASDACVDKGGQYELGERGYKCVEH